MHESRELDAASHQPTCPGPGARVYFDRDATNFFKGIAVLMLLAHHLWFTHRPDVFPHWLNVAALSCKLCVAIFLLLSGYGIAKAGCDWRKTMRSRIPRLLLKYWFVAAIFILVGIAFFGMSFGRAYPGGRSWMFPLQMLGLNFIDPEGGFNPTWWFMDAIIPLYLLSPILHRAVAKNGVIAIAVACILSMARLACLKWMVPFVVGMAAADGDFFDRILAQSKELPVLAAIFALAAFGVVFRKYGSAFDGFIALAMVAALYCAYDVLRRFGRVTSPLVFLGMHSMNIFMTHTFFRSAWFKDFFDTQRPIIAFTVLLVASLCASLAIEGLKKISGFHALVSKMR